MNLQEKIQTILIEDSGNLQKICFMEDLADEFAIGFKDWCDTKGRFWIGVNTTKELLEIYKKEKKL